nr:four helix bundle protein [Okeania sp. SIO3I5]
MVYQKADQFAIRVVKAYKYLAEEKKEYVLSKELLRSGTSIQLSVISNRLIVYISTTKLNQFLAFYLE